MFYDVLVVNDVCVCFKCILDVVFCGCVGIVVVVGKGEGFVEFVVVVFGYDWGYCKLWCGVEGLFCLNSR